MDPELVSSAQLDVRDDSGALPDRADDEYRPFVRQLAEFRFWLSVVRALAIALACTFVPLLDLPVFWPVLVAYFAVLVVLALRHQIMHMIKYHYLPFSHGKRRYR
eukprot:TRINITY_DN1491_c0_g1_i1.p2 TRINITY_DN1491_c0_g1~~TRINITY_DN1491_c0_g1_i1.p2  ORF type:complete len:105 (+),score=27.34 TRINITY_DN1491_c0_g1_i1:469-783(+)